jgi:Fur family transcriptional regulator, peroxide stress response regulator
MVRMTPQRRVLLDELKGTHDHPSADLLYERVRKRLPRISLGTVYRNLDLLSEEGLIHKLQLGGQMRFDADLTHHCHVRCEQCGCVDDVDCQAPEHVEQAFIAPNGYRITGHRFEWVGVCPQCQEQNG